MALKKTMNKKEVAKFHKLLKTEGVTKKQISVLLQVHPDTLAKFTPEAFEKARAKPETKDKK